jgi:hypothetical protein
MVAAMISTGAAQAQVGLRRLVGMQATTGNKPSNTALHQVLKNLHEAVALLQKADHDYDGHRAAAVVHLKKAIHELKPQKPNGSGTPAANGIGKPAGTPNPGKPAGNKEPQAVSDGQLRSALQLINATSGMVSALPHQHPHATTHMQAAVTELNTALKIR